MPALCSLLSRTALFTAALAALLTAPSAAQSPTTGTSVGRRITASLPIAQLHSVDRSLMCKQITAATGDYTAFVTPVHNSLLSLNNIMTDLRNPFFLTHDFLTRDFSDRINNFGKGLDAIIHSSQNLSYLQLNDALYVGASVQTGQGQPAETLPDLLYEQGHSRVTLTYANVIDGFNGQDVGFSYAVRPTSLRSLYAKADDLLRFDHALRRLDLDTHKLSSDLKDYLAQASPGSQITVLQIDADRRQFLLDAKKVVAYVEEIQTQGDISVLLKGQHLDVLNKYISVYQETAVSINGDYLTINGGGHQSNIGVSASKLLPIHTGGVPMGVTPLISIEDLQFVDHRYTSASGVRLGGALIWQDRTPALTQDKTNLVAPWNVKIGLEYATPVLGAHESYAEFVRYRERHTYIEMTVTAGKDGTRANYLVVSLGKTISF